MIFPHSTKKRTRKKADTKNDELSQLHIFAEHLHENEFTPIEIVLTTFYCVCK